jgi:exonuclease III
MDPQQYQSPPPTISVGHLNIGGFSRGGGTRSDNYTWFRSFITSFDLFCVSEVWLHDEGAAQTYTPSGYHAICTALRPTPTEGRPHGGMILYCRNASKARLGSYTCTADIQNGIIWLSLAKHRVCFAFCYLAPANSTWCPRSYEEELLSSLSRGITKWQGKGFHMLLVGDLNARIGNYSIDVPGEGDIEYAPPVGTCTDLHLYRGIPQSRHSQDHIINARGRVLLDVLRTCQLVCLNGRHAGDKNGQVTFTSSQGQSVVDYACVEASLYSKVIDFSVSPAPPAHPWAGVHTPLKVVLQLDTMRCLPTSVPRPVVCRPPIHLENWQSHAYPKQQLATQLANLQALLADMHGGQLNLASAAPRLIRIIRAATVPPPRTACPDAPRAKLTSTWWDESCLLAKNNMRSAHRYWLRKSRGYDLEAINTARSAYLTARSSYQSLVRGKKRAWHQQHEEAMVEAALHDPSSFWRRWATKTPPLPITDIETWHDHFHHLFTTPTGPPLSQAQKLMAKRWQDILHEHAQETRSSQSTSVPDLFSNRDVPISLAEVALNLDAMHSGKAADASGITVEALKACWRAWERDPGEDEPMPAVPAPHVVFRECLLWTLQRMWVEDWPSCFTCNTLIPIPKGAPSGDVSKYRGIAISNTLVKLHEHILFSRADDISERGNLRAITQCGFRKGHGTLDAIFTLNHLITQSRHRKKSLYVIFIDFTKAFDLVPRDVLKARCAALGFEGDFLSAIQRLYDRVEYVVQVDRQKSPPISTHSGTKQGSHISPLLFGWVIEQLHTMIMHVWAKPHNTTPDLRPTLEGGQTNDPLQLVLDLLFADDVALLAGSLTMAQGYLQILKFFCDLFGFNVNLDKSCWVHFRHPRKECPMESLFFNGSALVRREEVLYMGIWWHETRPLVQSHISHMDVLAHRATHGLLTRMKSHHISRPDLQCRLFKTMVRSAYSYGCQVWGSELLPNLLRMLTATQTGTTAFRTLLSSVPEQAQLYFLRILAGVGKTCHLQMILHEFGMLPVTFHYTKLMIRFWNRTLECSTETLLQRALRSDIQLMLSRNRSCWSYFFLSTMHALQLMTSPQGLTMEELLSLRFDEKKVSALLEAKFYEYLHPPSSRCPRSCASEHVKGQTYSRWLGMKIDKAAPHVSCFIPREIRILLIRLRLDCSDLAVTQGRYNGTDRKSRLCRVHRFRNTACGTHDCVEDLRHFILECPAYTAIRASPYFRPLFEPLQAVGCPSDQLCLFFNTPRQYLLAMCVSRMLCLRAQILSHKTINSLMSDPPTYFPDETLMFPDWWLSGPPIEVYPN